MESSQIINCTVHHTIYTIYNVVSFCSRVEEIQQSANFFKVIKHLLLTTSLCYQDKSTSICKEIYMGLKNERFKWRLLYVSIGFTLCFKMPLEPVNPTKGPCPVDKIIASLVPHSLSHPNIHKYQLYNKQAWCPQNHHHHKGGHVFLDYD